MKRRVYQILEVHSNREDRAIYAALMSFLFIAVVVALLETVPSLSVQYASFFYAFDIISIVVFSVEYALRLWSCTENPKYQNVLLGRIRYALSPLAVLDFLAISWFYLPFLFPADLRMFRSFRLFRLFRVLRMESSARALQTMLRVFRDKREEFAVTAFAMAILILLASTLMFLAERGAQPRTFSSVPSSMWWAVVTLSTVGYGDVYPVTPAGKFLGGLIACLGIAFFALPAGILASGFIEQVRKRQSVCPHCGKALTS